MTRTLKKCNIFLNSFAKMSHRMENSFSQINDFSVTIHLDFCQLSNYIYRPKWVKIRTRFFLHRVQMKLCCERACHGRRRASRSRKSIYYYSSFYTHPHYAPWISFPSKFRPATDGQQKGEKLKKKKNSKLTWKKNFFIDPNRKRKIFSKLNFYPESIRPEE